jgi:DNA-binding Xre family transcriptional regulator
MDSIIGHNIKALIARKGVRQGEIAVKARIRESHLSDLVNGRSTHPSVWTCAKIAKALGCSIDDLVRMPKA